MNLRVGQSLGSVALAVGLALMTAPIPGYAQTQGMERRDQRRDNRAAGRAAKQACKAGDEKTRAECRHMKRTTKQQGRQGTTNAPAQPPVQ
jgi:hypothetical protein